MSVSTETPIEALAFCLSSACPGNVQEPCDAVLNVVSYTYGDAGSTDGFSPHTERSVEHVRFADETDMACSVCGGRREISRQERPVYPKAGGDPRESQSTNAEVNVMKLVMEERSKADAEKAALRAEIDAIKAEMGQKANRSGPKPKVED